VGSGGKFVTPSLAGVATRPSFFHDGAYTTLDEMFDKAKGMGRANEMPDDERKAVLAYLGTL
jgi:cytochrome c peroxidase